MIRDDDELMRLYTDLGAAMAENRDDRAGIADIWRKIEGRRGQILDAHQEAFPPDPPNAECYHALVTGVLIENGTLPSRGDYRYLMTWGAEVIYLWTHTIDRETGLVSEVDPSVKEHNVWKSFASAIRIAIGLASVLESSVEVEYQWIYRFDPKIDLRSQEFHDESNHAAWGVSVIKKIRDVHSLSPILELLKRSDQFFVAAQNVLVAAENHEFCQECALRPPEYRTHHNHEPARWAHAIVLPQMEAAIVQATRAVEALLGKPGNRDSEAKLQRVLSRWSDAVTIDPNSSFAPSGESYLDYYYRLFKLRGQSAHSLGSIPFELTRQLTIEAQSFAWQVLYSFYEKHGMPLEKAASELSFDVDLVDSEPTNWSTSMTSEGYLDEGK